jgi:ABC-type uncharacterized transport system permease subunit
MHTPTTGQIALLIVSILFFVVGGVTSILRIRKDLPWSRIAAKACMYFGSLFALIVLVWHSVLRQNWLPLEDNFDTLIWLALVLSIFVMYVQRRKPLGGLDWFIMPVVVLLLGLAAVTGTTSPKVYEPQNLWTWVHLIGTFGGLVAFAVAGASGAMFLVANYRLRNKAALTGPSLGSLERLEHLTLTSVTMGFALLTIGAVTGFMKMSFEHRPVPVMKIVLSAVVWLVYAVVLHSPMNPSFRGRRAAMLSVVGFLIMAGTVVIVLLQPAVAG